VPLDIPNLLVPNHGARGASFRKRYGAARNRICDGDVRVVHLVRDLRPAAPHGFLDYDPRFWLWAFHSITSLTTLSTAQARTEQVVRLAHLRWDIGVSREGYINQSVRVRPRPEDSGLVAWEAPRQETKTVEPSDNILRKECVQLTRLQRTVNVDVASLHENPVAETVDNVRKQ